MERARRIQGLGFDLTIDFAEGARGSVVTFEKIFRGKGSQSASLAGVGMSLFEFMPERGAHVFRTRIGRRPKHTIHQDQSRGLKGIDSLVAKGGGGER